MIDAYASQPHYIDHMAPIWSIYEETNRFFVAGLPADQGNTEGLSGWTPGHPPPSGLPLLVAGYIDERSTTRKKIIYLEHGAGQTYSGDPVVRRNPSYSGGTEHERVALFLCPSETVAERWRAAYPSTPAVAVGCPKLDHWHRTASRLPARGKTVAITFHHDAALCPETSTALHAYEGSMPATVAALRAVGYDVIGHGHPRLRRAVSRLWASCGVPYVDSFAQVMLSASVLCVDNSSVGPEFASTGRPIVWMNAPTYRRNIDHGGRFWNWTDGIPTVDRPEELPGAVEAALSGVHDEAYRKLVDSVYVACDGQAAVRAAQAIGRYL